jgi:hypothetical protein
MRDESEYHVNFASRSCGRPLNGQYVSSRIRAESPRMPAHRKRTMKAFRLLGACLICSLATGADGAVVAGPFTYPGNGHGYYLLSHNTWTGAQAEASTLGGDLVTVNDIAENSWLGDQFRGPAAEAGSVLWGWIGLNDSDNDGIYTWADGDSASFRNWAGRTMDPPVDADDYVAILFTRADQWSTNANGSSTGGQKVGIVEVVPEPLIASFLPLAFISFVRRRRRAS